MRHLFALFCCILLVCRTAPLLAQTSEEPEAPAPSVLALEGWVQSFREADPVLREAALRTALAALAVEQSETPQHTDLSLAAGASADIWAWSSGGEPIPQAHIDLDSVRLSAQNRLGQRWEVTGSGRIGVPGSIGLGGSSAALGGAFYASVLGNHQGKLHVLESRYLSLDRDAAGTRQSDVERQRCWLAAELYVVAWSLQEQVRLFSELMETRQQNVQQTERDYRRGMVPRLDLLTAQSDVLGAQGEQQALTARLERALAALASFLETTPDRLLAPGAALEEMLPTTEESGWLPLEQHPSYLAWAHDEALVHGSAS